MTNAASVIEERRLFSYDFYKKYHPVIEPDIEAETEGIELLSENHDVSIDPVIDLKQQNSNVEAI